MYFEFLIVGIEEMAVYSINHLQVDMAESEFMLDKQAEDITLVVLFNCLLFLLYVYSMSVHEQEDKKTLQKGQEKKLDWSRIDGGPAINIITIEKEVGKTSCWQERKFLRFFSGQGKL